MRRRERRQQEQSEREGVRGKDREKYRKNRSFVLEERAKSTISEEAREKGNKEREDRLGIVARGRRGEKGYARRSRKVH